MAYINQVWVPYDENKSEEENIKSGAVGTAERMNHIEDGIGTADNNLTTHINNKSNPHGVTANNVGLGNVKNYGVATNAEAIAGVTNDKYMTPFLVSEALKSIKENLFKVQQVKVTKDDGTAALNIADNETILDRILSEGAGFKTGSASSKVTDAPSTTSATRFTSIMIASTGGSVIAQTADGKLWSRIISGSKWHTPWAEMIPRTEFDALASRVASLEGKAQ